MSSNPLRLKFLLEKYLDNVCSPQELQEFWQLMSELSADDLVDEQLKNLWKTLSIDPRTSHTTGSYPADALTSHPIPNPQTQTADTIPHPSELGPEREDLDKVFSRLRQKINQQDIDYERLIPARLSWRIPLLAAASILGVTLLIWMVFYRKPASSSAAPIVAERTAPHQVLNLPDGTVVILNHNSRLDYPVAFNGATREVYLTGEAYFDVSPDPDRTFLVHTGNLVTRVLGTAFNIKAYSAEDNVSVTVSRGKVQIERKKDHHSLAVLTTGEQLTADKTGEKTIVSKADLAGVMDWKKIDLVFDDITFEEAAVVIGQHYGIELRFRDESLRNSRFTGNFSNHNLEETLDIICELTHATWRRQSEKLILLDSRGSPVSK